MVERTWLLFNVFRKIVEILDKYEPINDHSIADRHSIANIAEQVIDLATLGKPLLIVPRLPDDKETNRVTLITAMGLGITHILVMDKKYHLFANEYGLNQFLKELGLPKFSDPVQPRDDNAGPYGVLNDRNMHWYT